MEVFTSIPNLRKYLAQQVHQQQKIGFVPTMGALHKGHISLIKASKADNDVTVCSIFVNPTQFNNPEDLLKYPRTLEADCAMLEAAGCDVVFAPSADEMYPDQPLLKFDFGALETVMEGASRPGHFNGVGIVVSKLFHIVKPNRAYFGQKDLQQVAVVSRMVADLSFDLELVIAPTVREADGLAMSSRNRRLNEEERHIAPHIFRIMESAKNELLQGASVDKVIKEAKNEFAAVAAFKLDYFEIVNLSDLQSIDMIGAEGSNAICVAVFLGPVRLIDNLVF
ncbi:pantoate--beta-alanine ligase [Dyadobacter sp.]|uniref:pantoate--beta-alanine ligase n=1 Tax=Dyadobacter sp. TaxID=1914288 RepID=UPI003F7264A2